MMRFPVDRLLLTATLASLGLMAGAAGARAQEDGAPGRPMNIVPQRAAQPSPPTLPARTAPPAPRPRAAAPQRAPTPPSPAPASAPRVEEARASFETPEPLRPAPDAARPAPAPQPAPQPVPIPAPVPAPGPAAKDTSPEGALARDYCAAVGGHASEALLAWQVKRMEELEAQLDAKVAELERKRREHQEWFERQQVAQKKMEEGVVAIVAKMRPDAAASQLAAMDEAVAAALLTRLEPRNASVILNEMSATKAARLADNMTGRGAAKARQ
jgi:flagellar motility protein MotE (MotC chaperone)